VGGGRVDIAATVKTVDRTGVEMEALTAVAAAALTIYDMLKSVDPRDDHRARATGAQERRPLRSVDPREVMGGGRRDAPLSAHHDRSKFGPMSRSLKGPASTLQVAEDIVPIGELKAHLSERIRNLRGRGRPLVVTQNGRAAAVLLAPRSSTV